MCGCSSMCAVVCAVVRACAWLCARLFMCCVRGCSSMCAVVCAVVRACAWLCARLFMCCVRGCSSMCAVVCAVVRACPCARRWWLVHVYKVGTHVIRDSDYTVAMNTHWCCRGNWNYTACLSLLMSSCGRDTVFVPPATFALGLQFMMLIRRIFVTS